MRLSSEPKHKRSWTFHGRRLIHIEIARSSTAAEATRISTAVMEIIVVAVAVTAPMLMGIRQNVIPVYTGACRR